MEEDKELYGWARLGGLVLWALMVWGLHALGGFTWMQSVIGALLINLSFTLPSRK